MKCFLNVKVLRDDHGERHYLLRASNGSSATTQDFYGHGDTFREFAESLRRFPANPKDEVRFELGRDSSEWAHYILLRAFCFDLSAHSALEIHAVSFAAPPHGHRDRFFVPVEAASLNRLGEMLSSWDATDGSEVEWRPTRGDE